MIVIVQHMALSRSVWAHYIWFPMGSHTHTARSRDRGERATDSVPYAHERNGGCIGMYAVRASTRTQCCVIHINSVYVACNLLHNTSSCLASRSHIHYTFMNNIAHEHCPSCAAAEDSLLCCMISRIMIIIPKHSLTTWQRTPSRNSMTISPHLATIYRMRKKEIRKKPKIYRRTIFTGSWHHSQWIKHVNLYLLLLFSFTLED